MKISVTNELNDVVCEKHISLVGEGIVWKCIDPDPKYHNSGFWFKVKGSQHVEKVSLKGLKVDPVIESHIIHFLKLENSNNFTYSFSTSL